MGAGRAVLLIRHKLDFDDPVRALVLLAILHLFLHLYHEHAPDGLERVATLAESVAAGHALRRWAHSRRSVRRTPDRPVGHHDLGGDGGDALQPAARHWADRIQRWDHIDRDRVDRRGAVHAANGRPPGGHEPRE
eukprot:5576477-Prymnesium_polylepis.4